MNTQYQWCNQNEFRKYPLREEATLEDTAGKALSTRVIADLRCCVPLPETLFLWKASRTSRAVSVIFATSSGPVLGLTLNLGSVSPWTVYSLVPLDGQSSGTVVFGDLTNVEEFVSTFSGVDTAGIEIRCAARPSHAGLVSLGRRGSLEKISGIVTLSLGSGVVSEIQQAGCYRITNQGDMDGLYLPVGEMNGRPFYQNISVTPPITYQLYKDTDGAWKLGEPGSPSYMSLHAYPDRPCWTDLSGETPGSYDVVRCDLVDVGLNKTIMPDFLGPCDRVGALDTCGGPAMRTLGKASTDEDGVLHIKAVK